MNLLLTKSCSKLRGIYKLAFWLLLIIPYVCLASKGEAVSEVGSVSSIVNITVVSPNGYDPFGIVRVTRRFSEFFEKTEDIFDENYLSPNDMANRADNITEFTEEEFSKEYAGARFKNRFNKHTKLLK